MFVKITRFSRANTQGMNLGMTETEEIIKHHRAEWLTEFDEFG